jgi:predicted metallo-beta-lactamase superfamily hydrolase
MKKEIIQKEIQHHLEKLIEHYEEKIEEIESELKFLNHKQFELEARRKHLYEKINKVDEQRMDALPEKGE